MKKMGRYLMTRTAACWRRINEETDPPYALMDGLKRGAEVKEDRSGEVGQVGSTVPVFRFLFLQENH